MEYLLSFSSTHRALRGEGLLKVEGLRFRLLPAPKEIAASCALVISIDEANLEEALALLGDRGAKPERVFKRKDNEYVEV